jgi:hypothetical protein
MNLMEEAYPDAIGSKRGLPDVGRQRGPSPAGHHQDHFGLANTLHLLPRPKGDDSGPAIRGTSPLKGVTVVYVRTRAHFHG